MRLKTNELSEYGPLDPSHPVVAKVLCIMDGVRIYKHPQGDWACIDWNGNDDEAHELYKEFNVNHKADYSWMAFNWLMSILQRAHRDIAVLHA